MQKISTFLIMLLYFNSCDLRKAVTKKELMNNFFLMLMKWKIEIGLTWLSVATSASIRSGDDRGVTKWSTSSAEWLCGSELEK